MAVLSLVFAFWCVPEVKGRSLEEVDRLFESGIPLRHFATAKVDMDTSIALSKLERMKSGAIAHIELQRSQATA